MWRLFLLLALGFSAGHAQLEPLILGVDRLDNGNTLIATGRFNTCDSALVLEVDSLGHVVWGLLGGGLEFVHTARRLANGNTLVAATSVKRVIEFDQAGNEVWSFDSGLSYPNEAYRLDNGNTLITDRNNDRVIEVSRGGGIVWSYTNLVRPHNGSRLSNGNTLICDSERDQVIEVDPAGAIVWRCADGLSWPRSAQRLDNGNTLIADSRHNRVVEVDTAGNEVWSSPPDIGMPYIAERLANGWILVSTPDRVVELDSSGLVTWQWPGTVPIVVEEIYVRNPATGLLLAAHVHRPTLISAIQVPAVVLVPDGLHTGAVFDTNGLADLTVENGFVAMHFDVDGRGQSDSFAENFYGKVNQEGLQACIEALAGMSYVDTARIGILTQGYGITLASGMLADPSHSRTARFLIDFEGEADRYQSSIDFGGVVPVPAIDDSFWQEREAVRFMSRLPCPYLRIQTEQDHNPYITDNRHCIALIDSATAGGLLDHGISPWTRVNDSAMNEPNRFYTLEDPPVWIPEAGEAFTPIRYLLYLRELVGMLEQTPVTERTPVSSPAMVIAARPNPFRARTALDFRGQKRSAVQILDMTGRLVRSLPADGSMVWDGRDDLGHEVASGVYYCRLEGKRALVSQKLVKMQ
jgi:hypothetical protein